MSPTRQHYLKTPNTSYNKAGGMNYYNKMNMVTKSPLISPHKPTYFFSKSPNYYKNIYQEDYGRLQLQDNRNY